MWRFRYLPLAVALVLIYNMVAPFDHDLTRPLLFFLSFEDILTALAMSFIGLELWRSAAPTPRTAEHQVANLLLFVVSLLELVLVPWCRSGTFFILVLATMITLIDSCYVAFVTKGTNVMLSDR